jgi:uncharacterized protein (DUF362 family)
VTKVIVRPSVYDYEILKPTIFIKPNLLSLATPQQAVITHPLVIKAAAEYVLEKGAHPQVSDSPAIGSLKLIFRRSGIKDALKGLPVACKPFEKTIKVDIGEPFGQIDMAAGSCSPCLRPSYPARHCPQVSPPAPCLRC